MLEILQQILVTETVATKRIISSLLWQIYY